ncbi:PqqD family peptide modification chaperone [Halorientalis halophila]|uniref:PqqD family peptide modification chaperone n=1 Tax=Halorientalis halophila TaxID=3108499 RepID=UPI0030092EF0
MDGRDGDRERTLPADAVVQATDACLHTTVDGEEVLLQTETGEYYGLNAVGTRIWEAVQEPRRVADVEETIRAEFDVSAAACREDVQAFLTDLREAQLLELVESDGTET